MMSSIILGFLVDRKPLGNARWCCDGRFLRIIEGCPYKSSRCVTLKIIALTGEGTKSAYLPAENFTGADKMKFSKLEV